MAPIVALLSLMLVAFTQLGMAASSGQHENGVFEAHMDDDGFAVVNRIGDISKPSSSWRAGNLTATSARFMARRAPKADTRSCTKNGAVLTGNDVDMAAYSLGYTCDIAVGSGQGDAFVSAKGFRYAFYNNVVAYVCNFSGNSQHCLSSEVESDLDSVQALCMNTEGYYNHREWAKGYGYGLYTGSIDFCKDKKNA
ncbi:hypothetical protein B0A48_17326 [Cryoendolithus antarcticus]|uniref:Ecp2 effector protein domain-containing protein n=1 Tax=Cryoendolithus antarcticus TaxID=1507870 RepID=A0A1V8SC06_9PEZI|nr:hypothetical protein B0A48_17326 [Cryoendolithus antarcticus]